MDWQGVVEKQGRMLREVLATLVEMAGLRTTSPREGGEERFAMQTKGPLGLSSERTPEAIAEGKQAAE